ncbi:MAG: hypothetical protein EAX96_09735 [Candidatus Lokiarchaeota archaeon]|nr:hypothetical protein [Candidatus Lokiarchaeota archaeon]
MEESYSLKNLIKYLGENNFTILLYSLLNRIPIFVVGEIDDEINDLINSIISLVPHRNDVVFYSDFIDPEDYSLMIEEELNNFNIPRLIICCPTTASNIAIEKISNLTGWILGIKFNESFSYSKIFDKLSNRLDFFLILNILNDKIQIESKGLNFNQIDLSFEKKLIIKSIEKTEIALEKMKRVLNKKIKDSINSQILNSIMNFELEENKIQANIFREEIQAFVHASIRALAILSRIDLLRELGIRIQLADKTLLQTIDYENIKCQRLLRFIKSEYGVNFEKCINMGWKNRFGDQIESSWG